MNNTERIFWLIGFFTLSFFAISESSRFDDLELLRSLDTSHSRIQSDQISDLTSQLHESEANGYRQGFEDGKAHAMITSMNGELLNDYADGYHAALSQFGEDFPKKAADNDGLYSIILDLIDNQIESEDTYMDILDLLIYDDYSTPTVE